MTLRESHLIHLTINKPVDEVYAFLSTPRNYAEWAAVTGPMRQVGPLEWYVPTAFGERLIRFTEPNRYGVLDHAVYRAGDEPVMLPMRVTANGDGCDLTFIFFRRDGMTDQQFSSALEWINTDFLTLRTLLEV